MDTTYRVIDLADHGNVGRTAATPALAKLAAGQLARWDGSRFAIEQTEWDEEYGKPKRLRSVIIEAEDPAEPWKVGL